VGHGSLPKRPLLCFLILYIIVPQLRLSRDSASSSGYLFIEELDAPTLPLLRRWLRGGLESYFTRFMAEQSLLQQEQQLSRQQGPRVECVLHTEADHDTAQCVHS
jgi:hypothetical protein